MLTFFSDLVNTAPDDDTTASLSTSISFSSTEQVLAFISCAVDYIEKHEGNILTWKRAERLLEKFSSVCNDEQSLRKIANIQSDVFHYRELNVSCIDKLSWK